jgi:hypothetical protein
LAQSDRNVVLQPSAESHPPRPFHFRRGPRCEITRFIDFFNKMIAKPFRWTYEGKPLAA